MFDQLKHVRNTLLSDKFFNYAFLAASVCTLLHCFVACQERHYSLYSTVRYIVHCYIVSLQVKRGNIHWTVSLQYIVHCYMFTCRARGVKCYDNVTWGVDKHVDIAKE